jgi:hypothetical protein
VRDVEHLKPPPATTLRVLWTVGEPEVSAVRVAELAPEAVRILGLETAQLLELQARLPDLSELDLRAFDG